MKKVFIYDDIIEFVLVLDYFDLDFLYYEK